MGFAISDPPPTGDSLREGRVLDLWAKKISTDSAYIESHAESKKRFFWTAVTGACVVLCFPLQLINLLF